VIALGMIGMTSWSRVEKNILTSKRNENLSNWAIKGLIVVVRGQGTRLSLPKPLSQSATRGAHAFVARMPSATRVCQLLLCDPLSCRCRPAPPGWLPGAHKACASHSNILYT
jgi:hypothetical protein